MGRTFEDKDATRERVPLLLGLIGPSGTGKTYSALRLATGIQRVNHGPIYYIDTESRRALHYADEFKFRHVPFGAPFSPLDYLEAIDHCLQKGAKTIIVDSMSHEHEGPGGVLEMHQESVRRMSKGDHDKAERVKMLAWAEPKAQRRRLINSILQMDANFIFCFRAKEKLRIVKGAEPEKRGFQPIAGEEFVFEMTAKFLLLPGADGHPSWKSDIVDERMMMKCPRQFRELFTSDVQLSEDLGEKMARWAAGTAALPILSAAELIEAYEACSDPATFRRLEQVRRASWSSIEKADKDALNALAKATNQRITETPAREPGAEG